MNIITQLVVLALSLLLVHAGDKADDKVIYSCCDLKIVPQNRLPYGSGVYKLDTKFGKFTTTDVYCDMNTDNGGWIVIQRNRKGSRLNFNKNWRDYEDGFGDPNGDFWAGLKLMYILTHTGQWEMRVDYQKLDKTWSYLHYKQFSVGGASQKFPLIVGWFAGTGTDWFASSRPLNGMKFSTPDNDNDGSSSFHCAANYRSGWWHNNCFHANLNMQPPQVGAHALFVEMKIRPKNCAQ